MGSVDWETGIQSAKTFQDIEAVFESVFPFEHAKYDYAQNGTKSKKFKEWFGDWEKGENVSKVVNEDGSPKETHEIKMPSIVYHGTANAGFQKFDPEYFDDDALFGPGFYFTENEDVATDYMIKGDPPRIVEGYREEFLKEFLSQIDGLLPVQERRQKSFLNTGDIKWLTRVHFGKVETGKIKAISKSMKGRVSEDSRMAVYRCYLNIRNPFDGDKDFVNGRFLLENMQHFVDGPKSAFGYQSLVEMYKTDRKQVNEFLQSIGYDGITHIGGNVSGGTKHRVWIAFNPKQIKHVNNQGTFHPDSDNILESAVQPNQSPTVSQDQSGKAMKFSLDTQRNTMEGAHRSDIGWIAFLWGIPGTGPLFADGDGLARIVAKQDFEKRYLPSESSGKELCMRLVDILTRGYVKRRYGTTSYPLVDISWRGEIAVIKWDPGRKTWYLYGYRKDWGSRMA